MAFARRNSSATARRSDRSAQRVTSTYEGKVATGLGWLARALSGDDEARVDYYPSLSAWIVDADGKRFGSQDPELLASEIFARFEGVSPSAPVEMITGSVRRTEVSAPAGDDVAEF